MGRRVLSGQGRAVVGDGGGVQDERLEFQDGELIGWLGRRFGCGQAGETGGVGGKGWRCAQRRCPAHLPLPSVSSLPPTVQLMQTLAKCRRGGDVHLSRLFHLIRFGSILLYASHAIAGEEVTFNEIVGMTELNGRAPIRVKNCKAHSFELEIDSTSFT